MKALLSVLGLVALSFLISAAFSGSETYIEEGDTYYHSSQTTIIPENQFYISGGAMSELGYIDFDRIIAQAEQKGISEGRTIDPDAGYFNDLDLRYYEIMYEPFEDGNMSYFDYEVRHRISGCWFAYNADIGMESLVPITAYDASGEYLPYCGK